MKVIASNVDFQPSGDLIKDITSFFQSHARNDLLDHSRSVAEIAVKLATQFGLDEVKASISGWAHDLGRIVPDAQMIEYCTKENIDVLNEEKKYPGILHQKVSKNIAQKTFGIADVEILEAIEVHTTLKNNVGELSLLLFLADKLSWEDRYKKGYIDKVNTGLEISLNHGAYAYLQYVFERKEKLDVVHPWMLEAYYDLKKFYD
jgi:predicted HD superfamily hydrolase involved in NAD metabolism